MARKFGAYLLSKSSCIVTTGQHAYAYENILAVNDLCLYKMDKDGEGAANVYRQYLALCTEDEIYLLLFFIYILPVIHR